MKKILLTLMTLLVGSGFQVSAKFTVKISEPGTVIFDSYSGGGIVTLMEEVNEIDDNNMGGELRVDAEKYTMSCKNLTSDIDIPVEAWSKYYRACLNPGNTNEGDVIEVTLSEAEERFISVVFDNPEAGYVVTLTKYDPGAESCLPGGIPFDCNEDETFPLDDEGQAEIPYDYEGRIRIRPNEGYSLLDAKFLCSNPHGGVSQPDDYGCIVLSMRDIDVDRTIHVTTVQHGYIYVQGTGGYIEDINMSDNNYNRLELTDEFQEIFFMGQKYTIRSLTSRPIKKVEVRNGETLTELPNTYGTYYYTPNRNDEVTIHTENNSTSVLAPENVEGVRATIYNAQGLIVKKNACHADLQDLAPGLYLFRGEKVYVR